MAAAGDAQVRGWGTEPKARWCFTGARGEVGRRVDGMTPVLVQVTVTRRPAPPSPRPAHPLQPLHCTHSLTLSRAPACGGDQNPAGDGQADAKPGARSRAQLSRGSELSSQPKGWSSGKVIGQWA